MGVKKEYTNKILIAAFKHSRESVDAIIHKREVLL